MGVGALARMPSVQFAHSIAANIAYWRDHEGLGDPNAWTALDRERENLFRAVEFGLQQPETWPVTADLALKCYTYVFERGYWSEWTSVLEQMIITCPDERLVMKGRLLNQLGSLCRKQRRLDEAMDAHGQAEAIGRRFDDQSLIAEAHLHLGQVFLRRRQYAQAEAYAQKALAGFEASHDQPHRTAATHNLLGIIALRRGDWDPSEANFRRAIELFRQAEMPHEVGRTMINLCLTFDHQGQIDEALAYLAEAATIFDAFDMQLERARLYQNLGTLHYHQGDLAKAEAAFRQADTPVMRRSGPVYWQSITEMNLGNVLLSQGQLEESRAYFLKCVAGFRRVKALVLLANSLEGLAETSVELGDRQEGLELYQEALAIVTALPDDAFANKIEKRLRDILRDLRSSVGEEA